MSQQMPEGGPWRTRRFLQVEQTTLDRYQGRIGGGKFCYRSPTRRSVENTSLPEHTF